MSLIYCLFLVVICLSSNFEKSLASPSPFFASILVSRLLLKGNNTQTASVEPSRDVQRQQREHLMNQKHQRNLQIAADKLVKMGWQRLPLNVIAEKARSYLLQQQLLGIENNSAAAIAMGKSSTQPLVLIISPTSTYGRLLMNRPVPPPLKASRIISNSNSKN